MAEPFHRQLQAALLRTSPALRHAGTVELIRGFGRQMRAALLRTSPALAGGTQSVASRRASVRWFADFPLPAFSGTRAFEPGRRSSEVILPTQIAAELGTAHVVTVVIEGAEAWILLKKDPTSTGGTGRRLYVGFDGMDEPDVSAALSDTGGWLRGVLAWHSPQPPTALRLGRHE
jgi:hypothetical protein